MGKLQGKVLITGGAGFLGSHLVEKLVTSGDVDVIVLDDLSSGFEENLQSVLSTGKAQLVKADVRNYKAVSSVAKDCEYIFHLAAYIPNTVGHAIVTSTTYPEIDMDVTIRGTLNILRCARLNDSKVLFASTAAVYGEPEHLPVKENHPIQPISPYGVAKSAAELYCELFRKLYGLKIVVARLFNVYGPRQRKYVVYDILKRLHDNPTELKIHGSGDQVRDFIYVEDAVEFLVLLMQKCEGVFNVGSGKATTIRELVNIICEEVRYSNNVRYIGKSWVGDVKALVADVSLIEKETGYRAKTTLRNGIRRTIRWFESVV